MAENNVFDPEKYNFIVGIDFGTTFSGASYVFTKSNNPTTDIRVIKNWPKVGGGYLKTPTVVAYKDGTNYTEYLWGEKAARAGRGFTVVRLFKLHLDTESRDIPALPEGLEPIKVISDYLRSMHDYICQFFTNTLTNEFDQSTLRYALTIPAMWSPKAKTTMREAAIMAGIINENDHPDRLMLIGEPEAAALYAEKTTGGRHIDPGKTALICDAGGGTVDLAVFEKYLYKDVQVLREITKGCGESSGSSMLDLRMWTYIKDQITSHGHEVDDVSLDFIMKDFIKDTKPNFEIAEDEDEDETERMGSPSGLASLEIKTDNFELSSNGVKVKKTVIESDVFMPVIESILKLIKNQIQQMKGMGRHLDYIILVGGFGQSGYLYDKILEEFQNDVTKVFIPEHGENAVSTGSVYFAMNPRSITHRIMRMSYGVKISSPFDEEVDLTEYQYTDKSGKKFCKNRFDIFIRESEVVSLNDYIQKEYYTYNEKTCDIEIYGFSGYGFPRYVTDCGVNKVAHFSMKLPDIDAQDSDKGTKFTFEMFFGHTEIRVEVDIPNHERLTYVASYESD